MESKEEFEIEKSMRGLLLAAPWIFAAFAAVSASLPFLPDDGRERNELFLLALSVVGSLGFGLGAWYSWRVVRALPEAAISVDEEGLWPTVREREHSLVRWKTIARLRERPHLQRLEALDADGSVIAKLEYQLERFERLRAIVLQRASLQSPETVASRRFEKSWFHHAFSVGLILGFAMLGWYVGDRQPLLGYGGMTFVVGGIAWEYWTTPFRVGLEHDALEVSTPGRLRRVPRIRIIRVEIEDEHIQGVRHPAVTLHIENEHKPVKLRALGVPAIDLYQALLRWRGLGVSMSTSA